MQLSVNPNTKSPHQYVIYHNSALSPQNLESTKAPNLHLCQNCPLWSHLQTPAFVANHHLYYHRDESLKETPTMDDVVVLSYVILELSRVAPNPDSSNISRVQKFVTNFTSLYILSIITRLLYPTLNLEIGTFVSFPGRELHKGCHLCDIQIRSSHSSLGYHS